MAGVRLKRLRIEKYRNVAPGTELHFGDGFNVLLGKNGTGKTTLLKLIAMIVADRFATLREQEFEISYEMSFLNVDASVHLKNERIDVGASLSDVYPRENYFGWSYEVSFVLQGHEQKYKTLASSTPPGARYLMAESEISFKAGSVLVSPFEDRFLGFLVVLFSADMGSMSDQGSALFKAGILMMAGANRGRFDESLGGFLAMTAADTNPEELPSADATILVREKPIPFVRCSYVPEDVRQKLIADSKNLPETITMSLADLNFLDKAVRAMSFEGAELLARRLTKEAVQGGPGHVATYSHFAINFALDDDEIIPQSELSYGQKRLLSFLYYAAANEDIIIADELVNGMHHDWAQLCVDEIAGHQSFLASQDPLLFDFLTFNSAEDVQKSFILCGLEKRDRRGLFVWKNLDPQTAAAFYRAYDAGIQHVSEILRTKGLW